MNYQFLLSTKWFPSVHSYFFTKPSLDLTSPACYCPFLYSSLQWNPTNHTVSAIAALELCLLRRSPISFMLLNPVVNSQLFYLTYYLTGPLNPLAFLHLARIPLSLAGSSSSSLPTLDSQGLPPDSYSSLILHSPHYNVGQSYGSNSHFNTANPKVLFQQRWRVFAVWISLPNY